MMQQNDDTEQQEKTPDYSPRPVEDIKPSTGVSQLPAVGRPTPPPGGGADVASLGALFNQMRMTGGAPGVGAPGAGAPGLGPAPPKFGGSFNNTKGGVDQKAWGRVQNRRGGGGAGGAQGGRDVRQGFHGWAG